MISPLQNLNTGGAFPQFRRCYLEPVFFVGNFLRFVLANSLSCFSLMELAICFEAPFRDDFDFSPRFAARAAPAAICCFFDFAGI